MAVAFWLLGGPDAVAPSLQLETAGVTTPASPDISAESASDAPGSAGSSVEAESADGASPTSLVASQPIDGATSVELDPSFRLQFNAALSEALLGEGSYQIRRAGSASSIAIVPASLTLDLTRNNLSFSAGQRLQPDTSYVLAVSDLRVESGEVLDPIEIRFTTTSEKVVSDKFTSSKALDVRGPTTVVVGPDGHLYVSAFEGTVVRVLLDPDGRPTGESEIAVLNDRYHFIGMVFDPDDDNRLWISQWSKRPVDEFGAEIVSYDLTSGAETKHVTGLPRHPRGDHSVQSLAIQGGKLYASVGSVTTSGHESFSFWGEPTLGEVPVSASIIEIDYLNLVSPVVIRDAPISGSSSPVRLYATGLRNAYDLVWHRNGNLYANVNQNGGSDEESTRTPVSGPCEGLPEMVQTNALADTLNLIRRGGYYGHPNPARGECIVMGGGQGPFAVVGYGPDQAPEPAFDASLVVSYSSDSGSSFGVSVNGLTEYLGGGRLGGSLLSADFSGSRTILVATLESAEVMKLAGPIESLADEEGAPLTFIHPLDVTSTSSGLVYVADFGQWPGDDIGGQGAVYVLSPLPG